MKNKTLVLSLGVAICLSSSVFAQDVPVPVQAGNASASQFKAGGNEPKMMVQQVKPAISTDLNVIKVVSPVKPATAVTDEQLPGATIVPVEFKPRPAGMNNVIPKEDVKPVLPSTIIKTNEIKLVIEPAKEHNSQGSKLAKQ
jgi:hypothetical protein